MHNLVLDPLDVLFFRDGRPMEGSLSGHGDAWPLPHIASHALLAALHRAGIDDLAHAHRPGLGGRKEGNRERVFGSLLTAGPFPIHEGNWLFPCPLDLTDACANGCGTHIGLLPTTVDESSLPAPLSLAPASTKPPTKDSHAPAWLTQEGFADYLREGFVKKSLGRAQKDLFAAEHQVGIFIDPDTRTTGQGEAKGKIYSSHSIRLKDKVQMGVIAAAEDKGQYGLARDLIEELISEAAYVGVGGQQRLCRLKKLAGGVTLPRGLSKGFNRTKLAGQDVHLVKWVLLSAAIWPRIDVTQDGINPHPGGWLPNWIDQNNGHVLLKLRTGAKRHTDQDGRYRRQAEVETPIRARLVSAIVGKALPITGWSLGDAKDPGAKSTHLAVAAGSVYYFAADTAEDAAKLAQALNWHGAEENPSRLIRRSTLLGEKGYGLGLCGTWNLHKAHGERPE